MISYKKTILWVVLGSVLFRAEAYVCRAIVKISNVEMVSRADLIVRATALEYVSPPSNPAM
jgi:hypothetical protein